MYNISVADNTTVQTANLITLRVTSIDHHLSLLPLMLHKSIK